MLQARELERNILFFICGLGIYFHALNRFFLECMSTKCIIKSVLNSRIFLDGKVIMMSLPILFTTENLVEILSGFYKNGGNHMRDVRTKFNQIISFIVSSLRE